MRMWVVVPDGWRAGLLLFGGPELTRARVYECLAYYEDHRGDIDWRVAEQMAEAPE